MELDAEGFWLTDAGIDIRFEDLSQFLHTRTFNRALQMFAPEVGVKKFSFMTVQDDRVCAECEPLDGRVYTAGQFMPFLSRHQRCRCMWDVYIGIPETSPPMVAG